MAIIVFIERKTDLKPKSCATFPLTIILTQTQSATAHRNALVLFNGERKPMLEFFIQLLSFLANVLIFATAIISLLHVAHEISPHNSNELQKDE
jgi:hypothetical protein